MKLSPHATAPVGIRITFPDEQSERTWGEKIAIASRYYPAMELLTVRHGLRDAMLMGTIEPESLASRQQELAADGLLLIPFAKNAGSGAAAAFSHTDERPAPEQAFTYRAVVTRSRAIAELFLRACKAGDNAAIGRLLGFPDCCCKFFDEVWPQGYVDPIWQQAERSTAFVRAGSAGPDTAHLRIAPDYNRTLATFRYIGARTVPHFSCSFCCGASLALADSWVELGRQLGTEGLDETLEILDLPFEWSCQQGVATVKTAAFSFSAASVASISRHVIYKDTA